MTARSTQDVLWGDYDIFNPEVDRPLQELPRSEARAAYKLMMESIPERLHQLQTLLSLNGVDIEDLGAVDDWFVASVQDNGQGTGRLAGVWYSVVNDIGVLLAERAIASTSGALGWKMVTAPKRDVSFQRHVIYGADFLYSRFNVDFDMLIGMYGHRIVTGEVEAPNFEVMFAGSLVQKPPTV